MPVHDLDALLHHATWLDRLSRQLTRDEHAAADAVQDTLLAAARRPPHHAANVRGFLATILRNVLRLRHRGDPGGELWAPGPLLTAQSALPPDRYEVVVDLGAHGVHRRFVDVRRCEVSDVTITLP